MRLNDDPACSRNLHGSADRAQFGLLALFEYLTLCGLILAFAAAMGVVATSILMAFALALAARQGWLALASLCGAILAVGGHATFADERHSYGRIATVWLVAAIVCVWYVYRRRRACTAVCRHDVQA